MTWEIPSPPPVGPVLETQRLILRPPRAEDFDAWAAIGIDAEVMRHLGGVQPRLTAWRQFLATVGAWQIQGFAPFSVIEKASGMWVGRVGPLRPEGWPGTEIGWTMAREVWGRGYAREAAIAAADWVFAELGWSQIIHCIAPGNTASQSVAEKLGSVNRGPGEMPAPHDVDPIEIWGQTREEWFARKTGDAS
ncbi:MAG: GNAT family N-acetyltransferase [Rhodanobacteraceae bacterium]